MPAGASSARPRGRTRYTRADLQAEVDRLRAQLGVSTSPEFAGSSPHLPTEDVDRIFRELGAGATRIMLWRIRPDGRPEYCRAYGPGEWSLDAVRSEFGGATYVARSFEGDEETSSRQFIIAEPRPEPFTADRIQLDLERLAASQSNGNGGPYHDPADPFAIAAQFAQAQATSMQAMMSVLAPLMAPREDTTTRIVLEALLKKEGPGGAEWLTLLEKARDLFDSGADRNPNDYSDVLREVGRPLIQALTHAGNGNGNGAAPAPRPAPELPDPEAPLQPAARTPFAMLAPWMQQLLELARENADPMLWAAAIDAEDERASLLLSGIVNRVGVDGALRAFAQTWPDADPLADWFRRLFVALLPPDEPEPEES